jgi:hypothetical protein
MEYSWKINLNFGNISFIFNHNFLRGPTAVAEQKCFGDINVMHYTQRETTGKGLAKFSWM